MSKLVVVAVGGNKNNWARTLESEYCKRLSEWKAQLITVKASVGAKAKANEAKLLLDKVPAKATVVCLDESGMQADTAELAIKINAWMEQKSLAFLVGGADGLDKELLTKVDAVLSLSKLTLSHDLARVVLFEQCYRAWTIKTGHPYHRE